MLKSFTTKQLIFIALMAGLLLAINFTLGIGIITVTGIPGSSAFVTGITNAIALGLTVLIIRKIGSGGLLYLIYGLIALPTPMAGGPPGFIWKVIILALAGITFDLFIHPLKYKTWGWVIGGFFASIVGLFGLLLVYYLLQLPEFDKLAPVIIIMFVVWFVFGLIGFRIANIIYKRIKDKRLIKQISSQNV